MWRLRALGCEPTSPSLLCLLRLCQRGDPVLVGFLFDLWFGGQVVFQPWNPGAEITRIECQARFSPMKKELSEPLVSYEHEGEDAVEKKEISTPEEEPDIVDIYAYVREEVSEETVYATRCVRVSNNIVCYPIPK